MARIPRELISSCKINGVAKKRSVRLKLKDIASRIPRLPVSLARATSIVRVSARNALSTSLGISINLRPQRVLDFIADGILSPTRPSPGPEHTFRVRAENCFSAHAPDTLIYGALNKGSPYGGAPSFGSDAWLELNVPAVRDRCTFTLRDSYAITLPFFAGFSHARSREALLKEIFVWHGVIDGFLDRFWLFPEDGVADYVEVQIWGKVELREVKAIHLRSLLANQLQERVLALKDGNLKWDRVRGMVCEYD